ncbi:unnamed protein product, partial [Allacma fusca]
SAETIQSLNPWVKIPEDWKNSYPDEGTTSSENFFQPSSAESRSYHQGSASVAEARQRGIDPEHANEPYFDHAMMTNLSEQLGNHAFLRCRVKNLGDRTSNTMNDVLMECVPNEEFMGEAALAPCDEREKIRLRYAPVNRGCKEGD